MRLVDQFEDPGTSEGGSVLIEAAVSLPLFMGIILSSLYLLLFCFQMLRFQYDVAESTRDTFTRDTNARGGTGWQAYFENQLNTRFADLSLQKWEYEQVTFSGCEDGWGCAARAEPGQNISLVFRVRHRFGVNNIGGIALPDITFRTKAVAAIQMVESE